MNVINSVQSRLLVLVIMTLAIPAVRAGSPEALPDYTEMKGLAALGDIQSYDAWGAGEQFELLIARKKTGNKSSLVLVTRKPDADLWTIRSELPVGKGKIVSMRGNDVQLAGEGHHRIAVVQQQEDIPGNGPLHVYTSEDQGRHWKHQGLPVKKDETRNQGYADIVYSNGAYLLAWLDDREENGNTQGLRTAVSLDQGKSWQAETTVDDATCTCCWTRMVADAEGGGWLLYRDHQPQDMALAYRDPVTGSWSRKGPAGSYQWDFNGCPHTGGGLAIAGQNIHAMVWTGKKENAGLHYLASTDKGEHWTTDKILDPNGKDGDLAVDETGQIVLAAWIQRVNNRNRVTIAISRDGGAHWSDSSVVGTDSLNADHPEVIYASGQFIVLWTERDGDKEKKLSGLQVKKQ